MTKINLRKKILKLRKSRFNEKFSINLSNIYKIFKKHKINNPSIGGYINVNYEINCIEILKKLEKKKFIISIPIIKKNRQMNFSRWSFNNPLKVNSFGIPEPRNNKFILPDVLLVPLVAFDKNKYRIGYGGGYYDRYIEKVQKKKKLITIGFAFSFQEIKKVPKNKYDKKLDYIITEKALI